MSNEVDYGFFKKLKYKFSNRNSKPLNFHFREQAFLTDNATIISYNKNDKDNINHFSLYYVKYMIASNTYYSFGNNDYNYPPFYSTISEHYTKIKNQTFNELTDDKNKNKNNKNNKYDDITIDILLFGDIYNISDIYFVEELMGPYKDFNGFTDCINGSDSALGNRNETELSIILGWIYKIVRGLNVTQIKFMKNGEISRVILIEPFEEVYINRRFAALKNASPPTKYNNEKRLSILM